MLVAHEEAILEDVRVVMEEVEHGRLHELVRAAQEAVDCYRAGHRRASQTLCATAISDILEMHFGLATFNDARNRLTADAVDARAYRRSAVQSALSASIISSRSGSGREGLNRHLSAHTLDGTQFTDAHALAALLLLSGTQRELHELYTVGDSGVPFLGAKRALEGAER